MRIGGAGNSDRYVYQRDHAQEPYKEKAAQKIERL